MHKKLNFHWTLPLKSEEHYRVEDIRLPGSQVYRRCPHQVHAVLTVHIPAPGTYHLQYLTKYMQYSPSIYLLQV